MLPSIDPTQLHQIHGGIRTDENGTGCTDRRFPRPFPQPLPRPPLGDGAPQPQPLPRWLP